jgi:hypothetical protein
MNYIEYLKYIPPVDHTIINECFHCIENSPNVYPDPTYNFYKTFNGGEKLKNFTSRYFNFEHTSNIHVIYKGIPIHKDLNRLEAFNYIIDTGGDKVYTCFYKEDKKTITEKYIINAEEWHRITTDVYHSILNLSRPRIAITVSAKINLG